MTDDIERAVLKTLYRLTAEAICDHEGHRWRELKPVRQPDATSGMTWTNSGTHEHCLRCGDTRYVPAISSPTTGSFKFDMTSGD